MKDKANGIAVCYHPATVVIIDDNAAYLDKLTLMLDLTKAYPKRFVYPKEALEFLQNQPYRPFTQRCLLRPEETQFDHRNIDIDVSLIRNELYNPQRFDETIVVIVDYSMPSMNGLDLCKQLRDKLYKIILLTGEAGESKAVQAFNEGIIDKFIRKDSANFAETINATIVELQHDYFYGLSRIIIDALTKDPEHPMVNWLDEPVFFDLFNKICISNKISEYYLTDAFGSFILLNDAGQPSWLAVKSEEEMLAAYEVVENADISFPGNVLTAMKQNEKVLYLHHEGGLSDNIEEVTQALHPAKKLTGRKGDYFYSFIDNPQAYRLETDKIVSYKVYRQLQAKKLSK
ncbi:MAG TPA: response regulator [Gammaproteobacteria bacterium]|nr:response regulator [Gammaproteobacteria bacterium]